MTSSGLASVIALTNPAIVALLPTRAVTFSALAFRNSCSLARYSLACSGFSVTRVFTLSTTAVSLSLNELASPLLRPCSSDSVTSAAASPLLPLQAVNEMATTAIRANNNFFMLLIFNCCKSYKSWAKLRNKNDMSKKNTKIVWRL